ncbi:DUF2169 family type VI secretion system accessory protein [Sorangium sp. So ce861]|uniref:DUF2169 family type VI secretion system accessory protein n=1 Tax=Sorangium sp. So ce861 TaxID=3133323 RepID=UPI003F63F419
MLEILNKTPFAVGLIPASDKNDADIAVVIVKGTFGWDHTGVLLAAEEQKGVVYADQHWGDPGASSLKYASDVCPRKPGADVALIGKAYAARRGASMVDVTLRVGQMKSTLRVFGDRHWYKGSVGWAASEPKRFSEMPLTFERAYGGVDTSDPERPASEPRNPVGQGFSARGAPEQLEGLPLPNLESPDELITAWDSRPAPLAFGFVDRSWMPRARFAGTYDQRWKKERCPLLPTDFDDRFHQAAHPSLIYPMPLVGGEVVQATGASPRGSVSFTLPRLHVTAEARIRGERHSATLALDTLVIEPELDRVTLTWRTAIPCTRRFLYLESVVVRAEEGGRMTRRR